MNEPSSDVSLIEWIIGGVATAMFFVLGHFHMRLNRSEDQLGERMDRFEEQQSKLHGENAEDRRLFQERVFNRFEQMATKQDLQYIADLLKGREK